MFGQRTDGRIREQVGHRQIEPERAIDLAQRVGEQQRVAAKIEEIVVGADAA
jgi:hypothetical protein